MEGEDKKGLELLRLLPIRFLVVALVFLLAGLSLAALQILGEGSYKSAHAHLMLAFFTLVIMGSMYQLIPTILGGEIKHKSLAEVQFILSIFGFLALAYAFLASPYLIKTAGIILLLSFLLFAFEVFSMILSVEEFYKKSIAIPFFLVAVVYLLVGSAYALKAGFSKAVHAHLMTLGFVAMTNFGGLYELFPMLALKKLYSRKLAWIHFGIANISAIGMFVGFAGQSLLFKISGALFLLGFYIFGYNMLRTYMQKSEAGGEVDISARFMAYAQIYGVIGVTAGFILAFTGAVDVFTHAHFILGWIALTIVGAMYHIIPMLTWMEKYSIKAITGEAPLITDLYNKPLSKVLFYTLNVTLFLFALSPAFAVLKFAGLIAAVGFVAFAVEMVLILGR